MSNISNLKQNKGWATGYDNSLFMEQNIMHNALFKLEMVMEMGRAIFSFSCDKIGKRWEFQLKGAGVTPYCNR